MAPPQDNRTLPPKEEQAFRQVLQLYEQKQYAKATETADKILKKFPTNGQTISMKALVIFHTPAAPGRSVAENEVEGMTLARMGVSKDADSQLCWHILGMLCRSQKDYAKASKSFAQALKADPHSLQILRDNASLCLHLRKYAEHLSNRLTLLRLRPNERRNWINLAVAYDFNGELEKAEEVLAALADLNSAPTAFDYEDSEVNVYRISLLMESEKWAKALFVINDLVPERRITDLNAAMSFKARALSKLGRKEEAEDCYRTLLEKNPDSHQIYRDFLLNKGLDLDNITDSTRPKVLRSLDLFGELYPRAGAPRRMALDQAQGDDFKKLASAYLGAGLERGVPSLFSDLKALYSDSEKRRAIGEIAQEFLSNLESTGNLTGSSDSIQPPPTYLWTTYFLALHHSHPLNNPCPSPSKSLSLLSAALAHTPTLPELYTAKARVLKYAGDAWGAAEAMEEARRLDGQDRFLNSKAAKYWLRAGEVERAYEVLGLFTKKDAASPAADLVEMQCEWFILEDAEAHARAGDLGMALKRYKQLESVFDDMDDDQFDFHGYCLRKCTLREYKNMTKWVTDLRSSPNYLRGILAAVKIYLRLADEPDLVQKVQAAQEAGPLPARVKKAEEKAAQVAAKAEATRQAELAKAGNDAAEVDPPKPKDDDPMGSKLLSSAEPLEIAAKLLRAIEESPKAQKNIDLWLVVYDVAVRRQRYLQAARALNAAAALDSTHAELQYRIVHFKQAVESLSAPHQTLTSTLSTLEPTSSPSPLSLAQFYLSSSPSSPPHVLSIARALSFLFQPLPDVESLLFQLLASDSTATVQQAGEALEMLEGLGSARVSEFREEAKKRWEEARCFDGSEEAERRKREWESAQEKPATHGKEDREGQE